MNAGFGFVLVLISKTHETPGAVALSSLSVYRYDRDRADSRQICRSFLLTLGILQHDLLILLIAL